MSAHGAARPLTLGDLAAKKQAGEPIVMVTAYDHPGARIVEEAGVDMMLVGDSAAMTVLGYDSTVPVTIDEMLMLTKAVRRGLTWPLLVGDLPFGSYEASDELALATAQRFVKEAGCDLVKIERGGTTVDRARALVNAGIPVVGHVGLTPQTATALGGYRAQGRTAEAALAVIDDALALQVRDNDARLDQQYTALFRELLTWMMEDPRHITPCTHLLFMARNLERVGDHATNIAENVWFLVHGDAPLPPREKRDETSTVDHA